LPVNTENDNGRAIVAHITVILNDAGKGPVHIIKPTITHRPEPIPLTVSTRVLDFPLELALPEQTGGPPPVHVEKFLQFLSVDRLDVVRF
jgi:hypothetical protein